MFPWVTLKSQNVESLGRASLILQKSHKTPPMRLLQYMIKKSVFCKKYLMLPNLLYFQDAVKMI